MPQSSDQASVSTPSNIFISYSHEDSSLVVPIVALLRASKALVFRDADSISPGKRWRAEIETAIFESSIVVVFWCHHAKNSTEVEKEFKSAIGNNKDVLPLLLDETPLPDVLSEYQYIDFRDVLKNTHDNEQENFLSSKQETVNNKLNKFDDPIPPVKSPSTAMSVGRGAILSIFILAFGIYLATTSVLSAHLLNGLSWPIFLITGVVMLFLLGIKLFFNRKKRHEIASERKIRYSASECERHHVECKSREFEFLIPLSELILINHLTVAQTLETELLRRTGQSAIHATLNQETDKK